MTKRGTELGFISHTNNTSDPQMISPSTRFPNIIKRKQYSLIGSGVGFFGSGMGFRKDKMEISGDQLYKFHMWLFYKSLKK